MTTVSRTEDYENTLFVSQASGLVLAVVIHAAFTEGQLCFLRRARSCLFVIFIVYILPTTQLNRGALILAAHLADESGLAAWNGSSLLRLAFRLMVCFSLLARFLLS